MVMDGIHILIVVIVIQIYSTYVINFAELYASQIHTTLQNSACKTCWNPNKLCSQNNSTILTSLPCVCNVLWLYKIVSFGILQLFVLFLQVLQNSQTISKLKQNSRKRATVRYLGVKKHSMLEEPIKLLLPMESTMLIFVK